MIRYRFLSVVEGEIANALEFYESREQGLHLRMIEELDRVIKHICAFPKIGRRIGKRFRAFPLNRFPFNVIYEIGGDEIIIVAVAHHSRRPGYWKSRLDP